MADRGRGPLPTALYRRIGPVALGWLVLAALLLLWQLWGTSHPSPSLVSFSAAFGGMRRLLSGQSLVHDVLPSVARVLTGFAIAGVAGIAVGLLLGSLRRLDPWVHPLVSFVRSIPPALVVPIALLILGIGQGLVVSVIVFGAFWPVLLSTFDGARRVDPLYLEVARAARVGRVSTLFRVLLPASLPSVMAGLRIALSLSLIMMVISEVLGASNGVGFEMNYAQQTFDVPGTYGAVLILAVLGWILDVLFVTAERRLLRWHTAF
jgi:ABC-type nitrate/sulfonate/bicarbonate transport system permease component